MKKKSGFTLVELLVVLVIFGIIVMLASSISLKNKNRWDLRGVSRGITATFYEMKQRASRENLPCRISFSRNAYSTWSCNEVAGFRSWVKIKDIPIGTSDKLFVFQGAGYPDIAIDSKGMVYSTTNASPIVLVLNNIQTIELRSNIQGESFGDKFTISLYPYGGINVKATLSKTF